jgi:hypothetical protein
MNRLVVAIIPLSLVAAGCTVLLDPDQAQCEKTADCTARGWSDAVCTANVCVKMPAVVDPVWGCLGHVPVPDPDPTKKITLTERLALAVDESAVTMATVDVCDKLDVDCTGTNPDYPKGITPDADGNVTFEVVQGFDGFVRISGPTIMDSRVFVGQPLMMPLTVKEVRLLRPGDYSLLASIAGQKVDMTRGTSILLAFDCQSAAVAGVSFESSSADSMTQAFYLINQLPQVPPAAKATDADGFGGFFNMPVGSAVAKSYRATGDEYIGESSFDVLAYTISYVLISPTPS